MCGSPSMQATWWLTQPSRQLAGDSPPILHMKMLMLSLSSTVLVVSMVIPAFCVPQTLESRVWMLSLLLAWSKRPSDHLPHEGAPRACGLHPGDVRAFCFSPRSSSKGAGAVPHVHVGHQSLARVGYTPERARVPVPCQGLFY